MTIDLSTSSRTPGDRLRWTMIDAWTITQRALLHWARQPGQVIVGLLFPVMTLLMFGYLFGGGMTVPGGGDNHYIDFLVPGMFAMTMVFGLEGIVISVSTDAAKGVTDRFRVLPMAASAVVSGRSAADMLNSLLGLAVMVGSGLLIGWRWHDGAGRALLAVGLLVLLRFALIWVGIYLGLLLKNPESIAAVQILVWPLSFLSSAFVAPTTMPGWLGAIAAWNPLSATVTATRRLFGNPGWSGDSWIEANALLMAVIWPLLLIAIFLPLSVWRYRRLNR